MQKILSIFIFLFIFLIPLNAFAGDNNLFYKKISANEKSPYDGILFTNEAFAKLFTLIEPETCQKKIDLEVNKIKLDDSTYLNTIKELHKNELNDQALSFKKEITDRENIIKEKNNEILELKNEKSDKEKIINKYQIKNKILLYSLIGSITIFGSYELYSKIIF